MLKKYGWCKFGQHELSGLGTMAYGNIDTRFKYTGCFVIGGK